MRPAERAKLAGDEAKKLSSLVRGSQVVQLLQQPLPAEPTAAQQAVLASCSTRLQHLSDILPEDPSNSSSAATLAQLLKRVLNCRAVHSAGVLLAMLQQQQPQPQRLPAALESHQ